MAHGSFTNYERSVYASAEQRDPKTRQWFVMPFGKYKGKRFRDIPTGYLRWALRETKMRGALRATVEIEVSRRED